MQHFFQKLNFADYCLHLLAKYKYFVFGTGVLFGLALMMTYYVKSYTAVSILRFTISENNNSPTNISMFLSSTENMRDQVFNFLHSSVFNHDLAKRLLSHPDGQKMVSDIKKSEQKNLMKLKSFFIETPSISSNTIEESVYISQRIPKIVSFKKDGTNTITVRVTSGSPDYSVKLANLISSITIELILQNESHEFKLTEELLGEQITNSEIKLVEIEKKLASFGYNQKATFSKSANPLLEVEKELRLATVELQRFEFLVKKLETQLSDNALQDGPNTYRLVDQLSIERLQKIKIERSEAAAKVQSLKTNLEDVKKNQLSLPKIEQDYESYTWRKELELGLHKELVIKQREMKNLRVLLENTVRIVGQASVISGHSRYTKEMRFIFGFVIGIFGSCVFIYYLFSVFPVVKSHEDIRELCDVSVFTAIPKIKALGKKTDIWSKLPKNNHATNSLRHLMEEVLLHKTVSIISPGHKDGKTFLITNLAENLSRFGKSVLVIDTDWRNGAASRVLENHSAIKVIESGHFKHTKDSFLDKELLQEYLRDNFNKFDCILIDTVASSYNSDSIVAASLSDMNIIVVPYLKTFHFELKHLTDKLDFAGIQNSILVMNKTNLNRDVLLVKKIAEKSIPKNILFKKTGTL